MTGILNIGLDLGSDSMKIAFAYTKGNGEIGYGKFDNNMVQAGLPAQAFYDGSAGRWYFADEIERHKGDAFGTIVKIKKLIALLAEHEGREEVCDRNRMYYGYRDLFPRFFFPDIRSRLNGIDEVDFQSLEEGGFTFEAKGFTPKSVCEAFFGYIKEFTDRKIAALERHLGMKFSAVRYAVIYPPEAGEPYVRELIRIFKTKFGCEPFKLLSTTRALAMYAHHEKIFDDRREDILVFDMGEEKVSVAKAGYKDGRLYLDSSDGHNLPLAVGGIDIDEAIAKFLEDEISQRPSIGNFSEEIVYTKQYRLMKDIKTVKVILSETDSDTNYPHGVPIWIDKEVSIRALITKQDIRRCTVKKVAGTRRSVAQRIVDYIEEELGRPQNKGVKVLFLSGGLAESEPLVSFLRNKLGKYNEQLRVVTFDLRADGSEAQDEFSLKTTEDGVYAPAIGGAIVALKNYEVATAFVFSYGTFARVTDAYKTERYRFSIVVDRGRSVDFREPKCVDIYHWSLTPQWNNSVSYIFSREDGDLFAVGLTQNEIHNQNAPLGPSDLYACFKRFSDGYGLVREGIDGKPDVQKALQWRLINAHGIVNFYYQGTMVGICPLRSGSVGDSVKLRFESGMYIDLDAHARRIIENKTRKGSFLVAMRRARKSGTGPNARYTVYGDPLPPVDAAELEMRLEDTDTIKLQ